jgi:hypothetical protein
MIIIVLLDVMLCSLVAVLRNLLGICLLHFDSSALALKYNFPPNRL